MGGMEAAKGTEVICEDVTKRGQWWALLEGASRQLRYRGEVITETWSPSSAGQTAQSQ